MSEPWAQRLATERQRAGLSLRQLGWMIGVSFSTLARIERGEGLPDMHTRRLLHQWMEPDGDHPPCLCPRCVPSIMDRLVDLERRVAVMEQQMRKVGKLGKGGGADGVRMA